MNKAIIFKNLAAVFIGISVVLISATFMSSAYYDKKIQTQIQTVSILKDIKFQEWGQQPNPSQSIYAQNFTLYTHSLIDDKIISQKSNFTQDFNYTYKLTNTSFAQGNSGRLNYIEHWQLEQIISNNSINIETLNFGADKVFNYDYYAPPQRKFTILYNYIRSFLANQFLQLFYAQYLYEYFFKNQDLVLSTVFTPLNYSIEDAKQIYEHPRFGWNTPQKFKKWVIMSLKGLEYASEKMQFYEKIQLEFNITPEQIEKLVYEKSTIYNMIVALNGTIKTKLMDKNKYRFKCEENVCSNDQLAGMQLANGFLTNDPIFASLSLDKSIKQLNATLPVDLEYDTFCKLNPFLSKIPDATLAYFFTKHYFSDFKMMDLLWKNKDKSTYIEDIFNIPQNTSQSLVAYVTYLESKLVSQYEDYFSWAQTNYNNLQPILQKYSQLFLTQLYSRGIYNNFIKKNKCQDYFTGDFSAMAALCDLPQWNLVDDIKALKNYIRSYLFFGDSRQQLLNVANIQTQLLTKFFYSKENSLFAGHLAEITDTFQSMYNFQGDTCSALELFCIQWGQNGILPNLPSNLFDKNISSINQWDEQNILYGFNPDFIAYVDGINKISIEQCKKILSPETGILSIFNLLELRSKIKMKQAAGEESKSQKQILSYISRLVSSVGFQGITISSNSRQLLTGYNSDVINNKKQMDVENGGAPWLENKIALTKLNNQNQILDNQKLEYPEFSQLNTGIFDKGELRQILSIWGEFHSSSKYLLYRGTEEDDEGNLVQINLYEKYVTDRIISGTNLLGFQPKLSQEINLQIYFQQAYQPLPLIFNSSLKYTPQNQKPINAYKYQISKKMTGKPINIKTEQLNRNSIQIMDSSYFIVEPITGVTLQFCINYRILSDPLFLEFIIDQQADSIIVYESSLKYEKHGTQNLYEISDTMDFKNKLMLIEIIVGGSCALLGAVLILLFCKFKNSVKSNQLLRDSEEAI